MASARSRTESGKVPSEFWPNSLWLIFWLVLFPLRIHGAPLHHRASSATFRAIRANLTTSSDIEQRLSSGNHRRQQAKMRRSSVICNVLDSFGDSREESHWILLSCSEFCGEFSLVEFSQWIQSSSEFHRVPSSSVEFRAIASLEFATAFNSANESRRCSHLFRRKVCVN